MAEFFRAPERREMVLRHAELKKNTENEKRIKLDFEVPLTGKGLVGIPSWIGAAMDACGQLENGITNVDLSQEFEGMTLEIFHLPEDKTDKRAHLLTNCQLRGFSVSRPKGEGAKAEELTLHFHANVPGSTSLWNWCYPHADATIWVVFDVSQPKMEFQEGAKQPALIDSKAAAAGDKTHGVRAH